MAWADARAAGQAERAGHLPQARPSVRAHGSACRAADRASPPLRRGSAARFAATDDERRIRHQLTCALPDPVKRRGKVERLRRAHRAQDVHEGVAHFLIARVCVLLAQRGSQHIGEILGFEIFGPAVRFGQVVPRRVDGTGIKIQIGSLHGGATAGPRSSGAPGGTCDAGREPGCPRRELTPRLRRFPARRQRPPPEAAQFRLPLSFEHGPMSLPCAPVLGFEILAPAASPSGRGAAWIKTSHGFLLWAPLGTPPGAP